MITPPKDADGSFYAVAFLESKPELTEPARNGKQAVYTNIRLGALVLLAAQDSQKYSVSVSGIKIDPPTPNHPLEVGFYLENGSNTHIFPEAAVVIMDPQHHVVAKAQGETRRFLPGQADHLSIKWSGSLPPGDYTALFSLLYGKAQTYIKELPFTVPDPSILVAKQPGATAIPGEVAVASRL